MGGYAGTVTPEKRPSFMQKKYGWELIVTAEKVKIEEGELILSTSMLCTFLGISSQMLSKYKLDGCPQLRKGWFNLRDVLEWRETVKGIGISGDLQTNQSMDLKSKKMQVEIELKEVQRDFTDLKKRITGGEYIERDEAIAELKRFLTTFKRTAMAMPRTIMAQAGMYLEPEAARRLEKQLTDTTAEILREMSESGTFKKR